MEMKKNITTVICQLDDLVEGKARGFTLETLADEPLSVIVVRQGQQVLGYQNRCPHTGVNLEWLPDEFMDDTLQYFVCATHGALFRVEDGECVAGPCQGESLNSLAVHVDNQQVILQHQG